MSSNLPFDFKNGEVLLFDKELEWTSFDVVKSVRLAISRYLSEKKIKVGHAGTLDPLATGLLVVCTGKATKNINNIQEQRKVYEGSFVLGEFKPSIDNETETTESHPVDRISNQDILECAKSFEGEIEQIPPKFSAVKVDGVRAYNLARDNKEVEIKSRMVNIYSFKIKKIKMPEVFFEVECSKGTYIRSLVRDFGNKLDNVAFLNSLKRTKIGDFDVKDALTVKQFKHLLAPTE